MNGCGAGLPPHFTASSKLEEANKVVILRYVRGIGGLFYGCVLASSCLCELQEAKLQLWELILGGCCEVVSATGTICGEWGEYYWRVGLEEEKAALTFRLCKTCEVGVWVWRWMLWSNLLGSSGWYCLWW